MMPRGRPLGLTLALSASALLYSLYPLAEGLMVVIFGLRTENAIEGRVILELALSIGFLILLVPAWLGRPPQIRIVLSGAVIVLMLLRLSFNLADLLAAPGATDVLLDSSTDIVRTALQCEFPVYIVLTLYVVWYLNRYPSRAYYGGASAGQTETVNGQ